MSEKIALTCWGCGWEGRVRAEYAGLRVECKRCRSVNVVPDRVTEEVYTGDWFLFPPRVALPATAEVARPESLNEAC